MVIALLASSARKGLLTTAFTAALLCVSARAEADYKRVEWKSEWPKFRWTEGVATVGFISAAYLENKYLPGPAEPRWTGGIFLDNEIRGLLRGRSDHVQRSATRYADLNGVVLSLFPYFDAAFALGVHRSPEVAAQIFLINAQAQSFSGSVTFLTKYLAGRQRPYARDCQPDGSAWIHTCGSSYDNHSFYSGHTVSAFTGAALICVHHEHLPLYGGGAPDTWACVWSIIGASSSAVLRIISDDHYASDVIFAAGVGFLGGYVVPSWLHYGFGRTRKAAPGAGSVQFMPTLQPMGAGIGIGLSGSM